MTEFKFASALSAFSQEERADRLKYSKRIYGIAWMVEILAASLGLYIAWSQGYSAYTNLAQGEKELGNILGAIGGALAFAIIAVLEPTKIFLAMPLFSPTLV